MKKVVVLIMSVGVVILLISNKGLTTSTKGPCTMYHVPCTKGLSPLPMTTVYSPASMSHDDYRPALSTALPGARWQSIGSVYEPSASVGAFRVSGVSASRNSRPVGGYNAAPVSPLTLSSDASVKSYVSGGGASASSAVAQHSGSVGGVGTGGGSAFSATAYTVPFAAVAVGGGVTLAEEEAGRAKRGALGGGTGGFRPGYDREDPYDTPIGDLSVVMVLVFAIGYAIVKRKKTGEKKYEGQMYDVRGI